MKHYLKYRKTKNRFAKAGIRLTDDQLKKACSIVDSGDMDLNIILKQISPTFSKDLITTSLNVLSEISIKLV